MERRGERTEEGKRERKKKWSGAWRIVRLYKEKKKNH